MRIAVVGVCAAGKSSLAQGLKSLGHEAYSVPQEHSGVKKLWSLKNPDLVIMLDASLPIVKQRRAVPYGEERFQAQYERLKDAKANADLFIDTDPLTIEEVRAQAIEHIRHRED